MTTKSNKANATRGGELTAQPPTVPAANGTGGHGKNVMSPLNWFVGIAETALMSGLILSPETWVKIFCASLVLVVLGFYAYVYRYFMKSNPDRLQTEEFNLISRKKTMGGPHA